MRTLLLYNPMAGTHRWKRLQLLNTAANSLRAYGFTPELTPTIARGSAGQQAATAIADGVQAVFACGGDGTVHDVLQGVAGTDALFGILPFGSANALACELAISTHIQKAAQQYRPNQWAATPLSVVRRPSQPDRYFLSMAGAGPDGSLMYRMLKTDRSRWGKWLYYAHAFRLFLRNDFPTFCARYTTRPDAPVQEKACVSAMVLRISRLGGLFSGIARGASLRDGTMRFLFVHPPAGIGLPLWFLSSWFGVASHNPWLTIVDGNMLHIDLAAGAPQVQADGEWLGTAPVQIALLQKTIRLLTPVPQGQR